MNDVSVYLGRHKEEESPIKIMPSAHMLFVLNQEQYVFHFANVQNSSIWGRNYKIRPHAHSFDGGPLYTQEDTDIIHLIKWTKPSPSVFAYCKWSKTGRWEGLGMRLRCKWSPAKTGFYLGFCCIKCCLEGYAPQKKEILSPLKLIPMQSER